MGDVKFSKRKSQQIAIGFVLFSLIAIIVVLIIVFTGGTSKGSYTSSDNNTISVDSLVCSSSTPQSPFFKPQGASNPKHELKIILKNDHAEKVNYSYTGRFSSNQAAEDELSILHANYNKYMGGINIYQEDLYPTFSAIDNDGHINLYLDRSTLTADTAIFAFLSSAEYAGLENYSADKLTEIYTKKGFSCQINN